MGKFLISLDEASRLTHLTHSALRKRVSRNLLKAHTLRGGKHQSVFFSTSDILKLKSLRISSRLEE